MDKSTLFLGAPLLHEPPGLARTITTTSGQLFWLRMQRYEKLKGSQSVQKSVGMKPRPYTNKRTVP